MDRPVQELKAVEAVIAESHQQDAGELQDLQLAFMGGGSGDIIFA